MEQACNRFTSNSVNADVKSNYSELKCKNSTELLSFCIQQLKPMYISTLMSTSWQVHMYLQDWATGDEAWGW